MLSVGEQIPPFKAHIDDGSPITEADLQGPKVVLYFYPKDGTPGCIKQASAFRDGLDAIEERGATLYGVSPDPIDDHVRFRAKFKLNFPLIADPSHALCEAFGVWGPQIVQGHSFVGVDRTTFVLEGGVITHVFSKVEVMGHVERILAVL